MAKTVFIAHDYYERGGRKRKYRRLISIALKHTGFRPTYADHAIQNISILKEIIRKIRNASFCILDVTGRKKSTSLNLNVLLELGMAYGAGRKAFLIYEKRTVPPSVIKELSDLGNEVRFPYHGLNALPILIRKTIIDVVRRSHPRRMASL
ncbi:hypothetical protein HY522_06290 [bacterium]|nr:hypothetical protein [bacterium]